MLLKSLLVWLLIAVAETLHGILRVKYINPRLGDRRARQVGVLTGTIIILLIGWFTVPWIDPNTWIESFSVGLIWLGAMLTFDVSFGRLFLRLPWKRIWSDFDISQGGLLGFGMAALLVTPWIVAHLRELF
jgi:hypothetical protein